MDDVSVDLKTPAAPRFVSESVPGGILAGIVIGFIQMVVRLSLASLIFSGPLAPDLPRGITLAAAAERWQRLASA